MGVGLLAMLGNGLTLIGISSYWNDVVIGIVLLAGVSVSSLQRMRCFLPKLPLVTDVAP